MPYSTTILKDLRGCDAVFALYRRDSKTLGHMPKGAFEESISNGRLLVAKNDSGDLTGYLLFRIAKGRAAIVHLCIARSERGKGVASLLVGKLKNITKHLECITLRCRREFEANNVWPKLGFQPRFSTTGRGVDRAQLTVWHFDHGHADLFSDVEQEKILVAIDTNIFLDLVCKDGDHHATSSTLEETWLDDVIELCVTPEIFTDLNRSKSDEERLSKWRKAGDYKSIKAQEAAVSDVVRLLKALCPNLGSGEQGVSDIRHLSYSIAAGVGYFVTRDKVLLANSGEILERFNLYVLTPVELIIKLDQIEREHEYQPVRLAATKLKSTKLTSDKFSETVSVFRKKSIEKIHCYNDHVNKCLSNPRDSDVNLISYGFEVPVLLSAVKCDAVNINIRLFRETTHELGPTVMRHELMRIIRKGVEYKIESVVVSDKYISSEAVSALKELGFRQKDGEWIKIILNGFVSPDLVAAHLKKIDIIYSDIDIDEVETLIWPAKIDLPEIPCYLVPIQSQWAEHFFDVELASTRFPEISDIREDLHLGIEAVYYSASRNEFKAPGYILWYVSLGNEGLGSMKIKAVSRLRSVVRGGPKELFRRYWRLGVYKWKDLFKAAREKIDSNLVALQFSHTETFASPLTKMQIADLGVKGTIQGPRSISREVFKQIYNLGNSTTI